MPTATTDVTQQHIREVLRRIGGFRSVYIPEFTWRDLRVDALLLDTRTRWARGFEIKTSRSDFLRDEKWHLYSKFCSSLSIACPKGLIAKSEVPDPFGLLYVWREPGTHANAEHAYAKWEKKPKRFQRRDGMAWLWTYLQILEMEFPRLVHEVEMMRDRERRRGLI